MLTRANSAAVDLNGGQLPPAATTPWSMRESSARSARTIRPRVDEAAVLLVEADEALELLPLRALDLPDVPFHPEVAEQGGDGAEGQVVRAGRGVRGGGADVSAHQLRRDHQSGPALDGLPFQGVVAVRGPDPVGPFQDAEVHAGAAGGAAFNLDAGMRGLASSSKSR